MIGLPFHILRDATPADIDFDALVEAMQGIDGVQEVHHVHVWEMNEHDRSVEAHVVIRAADIGRMEAIKSALKNLLHDRFRITHSTLEIELPDIANDNRHDRSEEHTSELHSLMRNSYDVFCLKQQHITNNHIPYTSSHKQHSVK